MGFETRPVADLQKDGLRGSHALLMAAFAELPRDLCIFVPRGDNKSVSVRRNYVSAVLRARFPERTIHTLLDREKDGVWLWWTPS